MHFALKFSPLCNITRPKEELLPNQKSPCGKSLSAFAARRNYNILFVEEDDLVLVSALKNGVNKLEQSALLVVRYQLLFFSSESSENILIELSPARIDLGQRPRMRQNYTFGIRTPWALADENNWKRTQRVGGISFMVLGVLLVVAGVVSSVVPVGDMLMAAIIVAIAICAALVPYVYSYLLFRRSRNSQ